MAVAVQRLNLPVRESDPMDQISKAIGIASQVYGIKSAMDQADLLKESKAMTKAEKERELSGILTPKELLGQQKDFDISSSPVQGAMKYKIQDESGVRDIYLKPKKKEEDPLVRAIREQQYNQSKEKFQEEKQKKEFLKTPEGKLSQLNSSDKQRYDNIILANRSVGQMLGALEKGVGAYSPIGDNEFTQALSTFEEALGRMQSGGAISKDEGERFKSLARKFGDDPETRVSKLMGLGKVMSDRLKTLGFDPAQNPEFGYVDQKQMKQAPEMNDQVFAQRKAELEKELERKRQELVKQQGIRATIPARK